jgi:hypothetical protein
MRKAIFLAAALTLAIFSLLPAVPVDAEWWAPAAPIAAAAPIDPIALMQQVAHLPVQEFVDFTTVGDHSAGQ